LHHPAAALGSGTSTQDPNRTLHSDSSTAWATGMKLESGHGTLTAAPSAAAACSHSSLQRRRQISIIIRIERSLELKLSTIWTDEAAEVGRGRQKKESEERRSMRAKGRKVMKQCVFFQCFVAPEGRKVGLLKRRVRSHLGR